MSATFQYMFFPVFLFLFSTACVLAINLKSFLDRRAARKEEKQKGSQP